MNFKEVIGVCKSIDKEKMIINDLDQDDIEMDFTWMGDTARMILEKKDLLLNKKISFAYTLNEVVVFIHSPTELIVSEYSFMFHGGPRTIRTTARRWVGDELVHTMKLMDGSIKDMT